MAGAVEAEAAGAGLVQGSEGEGDAGLEPAPPHAARADAAADTVGAQPPGRT